MNNIGNINFDEFNERILSLQHLPNDIFVANGNKYHLVDEYRGIVINYIKEKINGLPNQVVKIDIEDDMNQMYIYNAEELEVRINNVRNNIIGVGDITYADIYFEIINGKKIVRVLAMEDLPGDLERQYFLDIIAEAITSALNEILNIRQQAGVGAPNNQVNIIGGRRKRASKPKTRKYHKKARKVVNKVRKTLRKKMSRRKSRKVR
jgi:hypothetical protein